MPVFQNFGNGNATFGNLNAISENNKGLINMKTRIVFKPSIARQLIKLGYRIVDLKPQKQQDGTFDFTRSIYVFCDENDIAERIDELIKNEQRNK